MEPFSRSNPISFNLKMEAESGDAVSLEAKKAKVPVSAKPAMAQMSFRFFVIFIPQKVCEFELKINLRI
jgi:hypothetical protein